MKRMSKDLNVIRIILHVFSIIIIMMSVCSCDKITSKTVKQDTSKQDVNIHETTSSVQEDLDTLFVWKTSLDTKVSSIEEKINLIEEKITKLETSDSLPVSNSNKVNERLRDMYKDDLDMDPITRFKSNIADAIVDKLLEGKLSSERTKLKSNIIEKIEDNMYDEEYTNVDVSAYLDTEEYSKKTIDEKNNKDYENRSDSYNWLMQFSIKDIVKGTKVESDYIVAIAYLEYKK